MRKLIIFGIIGFTIGLSNCSFIGNSSYKSYNDEYKKVIRSSYTFEIKPLERRCDVENAEITILREKSESYDRVNMYWVVKRNSSSFPRDTNAYAKSNFQIFPLQVKSNTTDTRKKSDATYTTTTTVDSTKHITTQNVSYEDKIWYEDKFIIPIQPELISSIKNTGDLSFRFYYGAKEVTFVIRGEKLARTKRILLQ